MRKKDKLTNIMKANLMLEQRLSENNLLNELSGDKVMGAAKKMWQNSIGAGSNFDENPRVEKLISDHANKLIGMELFGGEIKATDLDLKSSSSGQAFHLYIYIHSTNTIETGDGKMGAVFYNYSTDQFMYGDANNPKPISGLIDTENKGISRRDARQLYKIAKHFNPNTRYVNYTREIPIKVVNKNKDSYKEL